MQTIERCTHKWRRGDALVECVLQKGHGGAHDCQADIDEGIPEMERAWREQQPTPHMPGPDDLSDAPKDSQVKLTTNTSKYNETCTAVELTAGGSMACLIFQDAEGHVILQVNTTYYADGAVICDVIDVERQYDDKRALVDPASARRSVVPFTYLVSADMRHAS